MHLVVGTVLLLGAILVLHEWLTFEQSVRIVAGFLFVFVLPGYVWSYLIWRSDLPWVERVILSLLISVVGIPMLVYFLNRAGVPLTGLAVFVETLVVIMIGFFLLRMMKKPVSTISTKVTETGQK